MSYQVAVTTSDGKNIDLHFGQCTEIAVYRVDENAAACDLLEKRRVDDAAGACHDEKVISRITGVLSDCAYLLTERIGPRLHDKLARSGIVILETGGDIDNAVTKINRFRTKHPKA